MKFVTCLTVLPVFPLPFRAGHGALTDWWPTSTLAHRTLADPRFHFSNDNENQTGIATRTLPSLNSVTAVTKSKMMIARLTPAATGICLGAVKKTKSRDLIIGILRGNEKPMTPVEIFLAGTPSMDLTHDGIRQLLPRMLRSGQVRLDKDNGYYLSKTLTPEQIRQAPRDELKMDFAKVIEKHRHRRTTQVVIVEVLQQVLQEQQNSQR
jgi:hypothetical protein